MLIFAIDCEITWSLPVKLWFPCFRGFQAIGIYFPFLSFSLFFFISRVIQSVVLFTMFDCSYKSAVNYKWKWELIKLVITAAEVILLGFQHYFVMLGTTVALSTIIVPLMGGGNVRTFSQNTFQFSQNISPSSIFSSSEQFSRILHRSRRLKW